jgi:hypothetical protein
MNVDPVSFSGDRVHFGDASWQVDHRIAAALFTCGRIVVLFDPGERTETFGQFPNLVAYDTKGHKVWTAELPTHESGDCYVRVSGRDKLVAYSWKSFTCEIDPTNGKIKTKQFTK